MKNNITADYLKYRIGGLFYIPAVNKTAADKIVNKQFEDITSVCFCLEDSVSDDALGMAEDMLLESLKKIKTMPAEERPIIFIRIRTPEHMLTLHEKFREVHDVYTGYNLPKFDNENSTAYIRNIRYINEHSKKTFFVMPILESRLIANIGTRTQSLTALKNQIDTIKDFVPNIRVGGNDFCNLFGLRRNIHQSIFDLSVVRDILTDIVNIFSMDYVVSGPVWEYFGKKTENGWTEGEWSDGLIRELELGSLNGFTGKTIIHPSQLPVIKRQLMVNRSDYDDAMNILNWSGEEFAVQKSASSRMNEVKCHHKWAEKIVAMGDIYGIREDA